MKLNPIIKKKIVDPETGKPLNRVFVEGKGWYGWNTVYHLYNSTTNYEQLRQNDLKPVSPDKCSECGGEWLHKDGCSLHNPDLESEIK